MLTCRACAVRHMFCALRQAVVHALRQAGGHALCTERARSLRQGMPFVPSFWRAHGASRSCFAGHTRACTQTNGPSELCLAQGAA